MGCTAPDLKVTGETAGDVFRCFETIIEPQLKDKDILSIHN